MSEIIFIYFWGFLIGIGSSIITLLLNRRIKKQKTIYFNISEFPKESISESFTLDDNNQNTTYVKWKVSNE